MLKITALPALNDNYIWVISDNAQAKAAIVDPGEAKPVLQYLAQCRLQLAAILLTHHHPDHSQGIAELKQKTGARVFAGSHSKITTVDQKLADNECLHLKPLGIDIKAIHIPGHTLDHTAYAIEHCLFTGDTLFSAGCGRVFEGSFSQMLQSLKRLSAFPADTLIYCGHEYTQANLLFAQQLEPDSTAIQDHLALVARCRARNLASIPVNLQQEKASNPFLRCHFSSIIKAIEKLARNEKPTDELAIFTALRQLKDHYNS